MRSGTCFQRVKWGAITRGRAGSFWPTVKVSSGAYSLNPRDRSPTLLNLEGAAQTFWPTLRATDYREGFPHGQGAPDLRQQATAFVHLALINELSGLNFSVSDLTSLRLSPRFCEWLMGFPMNWTLPPDIEWTESQPWETQSCLIRLLSPFECSGAG